MTPVNPDEYGIPNGAARDLVARQARALQLLTERVTALEARPALIKGVGTPEAVVVAPVGTAYLRTNGGAVTTLYIKESGTGSTGWVAK